jgi:hypothetical protein
MLRIFSLALLALTAACGLAPTEHDDDIAPRAELDAVELSSLSRQDGFIVTDVLRSTDPINRVGIMLNLHEQLEGAEPDVLVQAVAEDGTTVDAVVAWREGTSLVLNADFPTPVNAVQLRIPDDDAGAIHGIAWELFVPSEESVERDIDAAQPSEGQELAAWLKNSGIKPRSAWGARAPRGCSSNSAKSRIAIHHTVTGRTLNGSYTRQLRQIQSFHMDSRGYCDTGYHFLVTADGSRWEARPIGYLGAHVGGQNTGNVGISLVGCFHPSGCSGLGGTTPPEAMINGAARIVRRVARHYGFAIDAAHVKGHRQWAGGTSCPGDKLLDKLGTIRSRARNNSYPGPG